MASYRQFNQQQRPNHGQYANQMQNFSQHYPAAPPPPPHQQYPYQPPPPPPPPDSSYQPPPPPPPQQPSARGGYYPLPPSQFNQYGGSQQPLPPSMQPPPPPSSPPPPPPPSSPPPPPPPKESDRGVPVSKDRRDHSHHDARHRHHQQHNRPPAGPPKENNNNGGVPGRVETEEERRLRKKREFEKQREDRHRQQMKVSQNSILQKTQMLSAQKGHGHGHSGSIVGSRMGDRRATPLLGGERIENRLKKPTTFLCKMKFRNELPDPSAQPKLMTMKRDKDRFTKYAVTSLEKMYKPQLFVEPDLGIPLDLLDLSVYNPPKDGQPLTLDPADEELLRDDEAVTPVKREGLRIKDRPTDKGVSWLVKTQYISSVSADTTKQSMNEKQAKELREKKVGRNLLENLNSRESQIKEIEASFEACKQMPVHATNKSLKPVEILPLLPDFDRYDDKFVSVTFDNAPTADSEIYSKLDEAVREACESRAVMKACVATGFDPANPEKFLAYMAPSPNELSKDIFDENEDVSYNWIREYHWDVRGDDANDPTTFLVSFDEDAARYVPLPTKINLRKKRAREGRTGDEVEHFPAPASVTVRRRPIPAARELRDSWGASSSRGNGLNSRMGTADDEDDLGRSHKMSRGQDMDNYSEGEDDLSE